jgi:hypothetical protein
MLVPYGMMATHAVGAITIPSPWSSALRTMATYFSMRIMVRIQNVSDAAPRMSCLDVGCVPKRVANAYKGEVPMSPYTTPKLPNARMRKSFCDYDGNC